MRKIDIQSTGIEPESAVGSLASGPATPIDTYHRYYCGNMVYDRRERRLLTDEGYVTFAADGTPQYHFYLRDHLGNIRVVFDQTGAVEQVTHYYPFGGVMRESTNPGLQPYKYGGKELDRTSGLDAYDFGARMYFADRLQWGQMDPFCEKYYDVSPYNYCINKPVNAFDPDGRKTYLFVTTLPYAKWFPFKLSSPSHSFIVVRNEEGTNYYAFGSDSPHGLGGNLVRASYTQDKKIFENFFNDVQNSNLKNVFEIPTPDGVTEKDFDNRVIDIAESFYEGGNNQMNYALDPGYSNDQGNCNTSTSTILFKAGIGKNELMKMKDEMKGLTWGFGKIRPWTKEEQEKAAQENEREKDIIECYQKEGW